MTKHNPSPESGEGETTWLCMQSRFLTAIQTIEGGDDREWVMDRERRFPHCDRICHIIGFCMDQQNVLRPVLECNCQCFSGRKLTL